MPTETILIADDQREILEPIRRTLEAVGYQVVTACDGLQALERFEACEPALVILDVMMPRLNGLEVCRCIRSQSDVPVMMLTARAEEADVVLGLETGADDYLTKPFRVNELLARVRAIMRRSERTPESLNLGDREESGGERLAAAGILLDTARHEVTVEGRRVALTPVEFRLLQELLRRPGEVCSRETLMRAACDYEGYDPGVLNTHIRRLRAKIGDDDATPPRILTIRGFGYKLAA